MNNNINNQGGNNSFPTNESGIFTNNEQQPISQPFINNNFNNTLNQNNQGVNNNMNIQNNHGMNNTIPTNENGMFPNNNIQSFDPEMNSNQPNINKNIPNKQNKKFIPIVVIAAIVVIILALNLGNSNSTENSENNIDSSTSNNSTTENNSSTPNNSTINKGETIKIRADEEKLNIDLKYVSYDPTRYAENREVLFEVEITNKSKKKRHMIGADINIYDSSNNEIGRCTGYSTIDKLSGTMAPLIDPEKSMIVYYYCYIYSTSDLSQIAKVKYENSFINSDWEDEKVQYYLNIK